MTRGFSQNFLTFRSWFETGIEFINAISYKMRFHGYFLVILTTSVWSFVRGEPLRNREMISTGVSDEDILVGDTLSKVETFEDLKVNFSFSCDNLMSNEVRTDFLLPQFEVKLTINDSDIASFPGDSPGKPPSPVSSLTCSNNRTSVIHLKGGHLGITKMKVELVVNESYTLEIKNVEIRVKREMTVFDEVTFFLLGPLILLNKCAFGAKIEISVLRQIFTQPLALSLCLLMQFFVMPLFALMYSTLFHLDQTLALALFVAATCPGGGGGYVLSFLVGGDVTLAISASLLSTVVAMGAMPGVLGLYAYFMDIPDKIAIPYFKIILILLAIAIPISAGMFINRKWPEFAKKLVKIIQPLSLFLIFCGFLFLAVSSRYIIHGPPIGWALAVAVPLTTLVVAIAFAQCLGLSWPFAKAISLESGMKNTVLGIAVIELTYPQPEADLSSILIIMVTLGHTSLTMLWYFGHLIRERCCREEEVSVRFTKLDDGDEEDEECDEKMEFISMRSS